MCSSDLSSKIQAYFRLDNLGEEKYAEFKLLDIGCLLAEYLHQLILGEYLRVTTIMKNLATIIQAFENDKQYEIELISTHIIPYFRLVVYGVLTTDNGNLLSHAFLSSYEFSCELSHKKLVKNSQH